MNRSFKQNHGMVWVGKDLEDLLDLPLDQVAPSHKTDNIYILYTGMDRQKYRYAFIRISTHTSKN